MLKEIALNFGPIARLHESRNAFSHALDDANASIADANARIADLKRKLETQSIAAEQDIAAAKSPFFHYSATFDAVALMHHHAVAGLEATPGMVTNFLGVKIDPKFFPSILDGKAGQVEATPIPANWHADIAEWGTALRAVELAGKTFTMIELGCGWGCWMNNTGVAARRAGRTVHLIGVEGDAGHLAFAKESMAANGFTPESYTLHRGIAAPNAGVALFPNVQHAGLDWGLEPVFDATQEQQARAEADGTHDLLPMVAMAELVGERERIDLLHIDIQGGEADLIDGCIELLGRKVAYLLIGTHSKEIEGRLYARMLAAGWLLEMERPAIFAVHAGKPVIAVDGVQGWRNPSLLP